VFRKSRSWPRSRRLSHWLAVLAAAVVCLGCSFATGNVAGASSATTYQEPYRPQFHFTPAQNWMNDPNGLIYYKGTYNLFFQYNPSGSEWGNISWGHAVSTDLVHWKELPVAIPDDDNEYIYSGSAVLDKDNTSGFGTKANPPIVAVYTSTQKATGVQEQALAYSTDGGLTFTKYAGNPVININSQNFRDPKVFWYAPKHEWMMIVALSAQQEVQLYSSPNLKQWTYLSEFGPAGVTTGAWECPDLFPLALNGNPKDTKWVLVVNTNPGSLNNNSGTQYFVGEFDGTRFVPDEPVSYTPPAGSVYDDFESDTYGSWTTTGTAFGTGPAHGTLPDQQQVSGYLGNGLVNSYLGEDASTGTLTSPTFTITKPYINFLIGGGDHPYDQPNPTAVTLVVDGKVVRSATGDNNEFLDWTSFDVRDLAGKQARIQIVDDNTQGWGHINADQFMFADQPALSQAQRAHWVDYGEDFYAANSYNDAPGGKRIELAWMTGLSYAGSIPTSPWRGADTFPRELSLRTINGTPTLIEQPVSQLATLHDGPAVTADNVSVVNGTRPLPVTGETLEIKAELSAGDSRDFGLDVRVGDNEYTRIGYDTATHEVYIDRGHASDVTVDPTFGAVQSAPLPLTNGKLTLHILVDADSVEVFAGQGQVAMTDQIFPEASAGGVDVFATQGGARLDQAQIWHLSSIWNQ
jgi:beta-fructofuranosidase/levanase